MECASAGDDQGVGRKLIPMFTAFKTELDLNNRQRTACLQHAGVARFAFNWALSQKKSAMDAREKIPNAIALHRRLNALKPTEFPWMYDVSKCAPQEALRNLDRAFDNFFRKCKLRKSGKLKGKVGFPRFKSKRKGIGSFRLTGSIKVTDRTIQLPRLGVLRLKERDYLPSDAKILSATVSERAGRWFVSLRVEVSTPEPAPKACAIIGVDLGIKTLAVVSDGTSFANPKPLVSSLKKLRRLSQNVSRKLKGSNNRRKAVRRLSRFHYRIANLRSDALHKMTTMLTKTKSAIGIEDLNVSGMLRNRHLSRAIADLGLSEWRRQLEYKGPLYGCEIVVADRFYPSSKTCSVCGEINESLTLADRFWTCPGCGTVHDRDFNASKNLERLAVSFTESLNARGRKSSGRVSVRLGETGPVEAGTEHGVSSEVPVSFGERPGVGTAR